MKNNLPFVSIVIACRDEEKFIGKCLDSILAQNYPKEKIEVLVVDGISEDETKQIVRKYSKKHHFIKLLANPKKFTNFAFNVGLKASRGEIIMLMGAHAGYEKNYVSKCVKYLSAYDADNVGGIMKTLPRKKTLTAKAIAIVLSHPFGAGGSYFRIGSKKPRWVDTVFGGCYKREVFDKVGLFNENLIRSQDMEFNLRLKRSGGKILLAPEIVSYYYPKSRLEDFFIHNFKDGFWQTYEFKFTKKLYCLRHYIPLLFVISLLGTAIYSIFSEIFLWLFLLIFSLYFLVNFYFSAKITLEQGNWRYFFVMPFVFACRHIGHGFGSLIGVIKIFI